MKSFKLAFDQIENIGIINVCGGWGRGIFSNVLCLGSIRSMQRVHLNDTSCGKKALLTFAEAAEDASEQTVEDQELHSTQADTKHQTDMD